METAAEEVLDMVKDVSDYPDDGHAPDEKPEITPDEPFDDNQKMRFAGESTDSENFNPEEV